MRSLSKENPFGPIPKGAVWEALKAHGVSNSHLDYGGFDGEALLQFHRSGLILSGVSFDLNRDVVEKNAGRMPDGTSLKLIVKGETLPLSDRSVTTISAIGVIEHIADQKSILLEFSRVLKDDGILVLAVPGKHLFSFLDMGNWKFVFPKAHRMIYSSVNSAEEYHRRYVECDNGMFGDIETEKMWHEHFSAQSMEELLRGCGFRLVDQDGLGFFQRIISNIMFFMPRPIKTICSNLHRWDAKFFSQTELCFVAEKI